jgi:hypothetical protein
MVLESAKDQFLGVDTQGQYVRYGAACLLITNTIGYVPCSEEWELAW